MALSFVIHDMNLAELVSMNETFVKARALFDRMMEESLARHSGRESFLVSQIPRFSVYQ